jgi:ubiquinone/menaquinone biosynthesis C-methylase UbiE
MSYSTDAIQAIYDKAYAHPGLMGTQVDGEYSRVTKTALLKMCQGAPNARLLDMGTGDGDLWQFAPTSLEWHAMDISQVGTSRAVARFPRLRATVAITESLPYSDSFFGAVIAADTMEHVFDVERSLCEVKRILTPGGRFALSVPAPHSLRQWAYNHFLRQVPSLTMLPRLFWTVARRQWLFGRAAFQPIDRDLALDDWCAQLERQGFRLTTTVEWPASPLRPIVYLIGTEIKKV